MMIGKVTLAVEVPTQADYALPREDTEHLTLVLGKLWWWPLVYLVHNGWVGNVPFGASRLKASKSSLKNAWTPVRLR
jgi:hypothetical protein